MIARAAKIMLELILVKNLSIAPIVISKQVNSAAFINTEEITVQIEQTSLILQHPREKQKRQNHAFDYRQRKGSELRKLTLNQTRKSFYQMTLNNLTVKNLEKPLCRHHQYKYEFLKFYLNLECQIRNLYRTLFMAVRIV